MNVCHVRISEIKISIYKSIIIFGCKTLTSTVESAQKLLPYLKHSEQTQDRKMCEKFSQKKIAVNCLRIKQKNLKIEIKIKDRKTSIIDKNIAKRLKCVSNER